MIKKIVEESGAQVDINDDSGNVYIAAVTPSLPTKPSDDA